MLYFDLCIHTMAYRHTHRHRPDPVAKLEFAVVYTPRNQVLSTILEKLIKTDRFIVESSKGRFIQCSNFGKRDKETHKALLNPCGGGVLK